MKVDLTRFGAERIEAAIEAAVKQAGSDALPPFDRLASAAKTAVDSPGEPSSTYFQSILEIAYLVASADGFADEERRALSKVLERVVGRAIDLNTLDLHFRDLDDGCAVLGRPERLLRAANDFVDGEYRREVLGFAALVAVADGTLAEPEVAALVQVGAYLGWSETEVTTLVHELVGRLVDWMESGEATS